MNKETKNKIKTIDQLKAGDKVINGQLKRGVYIYRIFKAARASRHPGKVNILFVGDYSGCGLEYDINIKFEVVKN